MRAKGQPSARLVCLPSGRRVRLRVDLSAPAVLDRPERRKERALWADTRAALRSGALLALDAETNVLLDDAAIGRLGLADFHVLRDYAMRSGLVRSERPAP